MDSRLARSLVAAAVAVVALLAIGDIATSSPALCGSCHEMGPRTEAWRRSPHAQVKCVRCHVAPHAWYAFPQQALGIVKLLRRDYTAHVAGTFSGAIDSHVPGVAPMADEVCLQCHDPNRKPTAGYGILIDHPAHARRNKSCISCHVRTAHPRETRGVALSLMGQCFTCHGDPAKPKASTRCGLCHPSDYQLRPQSHSSAEWKRGHGRIYAADPKQCAMCHKQRFCDDCHGLRMPHPRDWAQQGKVGHAQFASRDRSTCAKCHEEKPDLCSMCHHKGYDPSKGSWVKQHFQVVQQKGASFCLDCHGPVYCARCHVSGNPAGG